MKIYLINTSTFLDDEVDSTILKLFEGYIRNKIDLEILRKFYDFLTELVDQFQSSSFGNATFAKILVYLLRMEHDAKYRHLIWNELRDVLHLLSVEPLLNLEGYFYPIETNSKMLTLYESCLTAG
jgi:hypothetical protein